MHFSVSEECFMGRSMSVHLVFHHNVPTVTMDHPAATTTFDTTFAFVIPMVALLTLSRVDTKNAFGILLDYKKCPLPTLFHNRSIA
jgi:hypothetical protein